MWSRGPPPRCRPRPIPYDAPIIKVCSEIAFLHSKPILDTLESFFSLQNGGKSNPEPTRQPLRHPTHTRLMVSAYGFRVSRSEVKHVTSHHASGHPLGHSSASACGPCWCGSCCGSWGSSRDLPAGHHIVSLSGSASKPGTPRRIPISVAPVASVAAGARGIL